MNSQAWINGINVGITVCDARGIIVEMNDQAAATFANEGGKALLGKSFWECHPEAAQKKIRRIMGTQASNCYTIEKNGVKKMIFQTPWHEKDAFAGLVEISMVIPNAMPHFVRN